MGKVKIESEASEKKKSTYHHLMILWIPMILDVEENMSSKSDVSSLLVFFLSLC